MRAAQGGGPIIMSRRARNQTSAGAAASVTPTTTQSDAGGAASRVSVAGGAPAFVAAVAALDVESWPILGAMLGAFRIFPTWHLPTHPAL